MVKNDKPQWGILSTANIGLNHVIPGMQKSDKLTVAAIASRDGARAEEAARAHGIERAHGSYEALLADPEIDAIYNPLPNHLHVPWTIKALEAGKHVLCEKPIALTAAEAATLIAARDKAGKLVAEAFMVRHHPQWKRAAEIAGSGTLGEVRAIQTIFSYFNDNPDNVRNMADIGGGALYDIGCYAIVTARLIFGAEPERVVSLVDFDPTFRTDRLASAILDFGEGRRLTFTCATQLVPRQEVAIYGTRKSLTVEIPFNQNPARSARLSIDDGGAIRGEPPETIEIPPADQYMLQAETFGAAILTGAPLAHPIEDAVANMAVIDALFQSAKSGGWVSL